MKVGGKAHLNPAFIHFRQKWKKIPETQDKSLEMEKEKVYADGKRNQKSETSGSDSILL